MKKVINLNLAMIFALLSFTSCVEDRMENNQAQESAILLTPEEYASVAYDSTSTISENEAWALVANLKSSISTRSSRNTATVRKNVITGLVQTLANAKRSINVPCYEFTFDGNGFAVVAADSRCPMVVAYADKGNLADTLVNKGAAKMLDVSKKIVLSQVGWYEKMKDSLQTKTLQKISQKIGVDSIGLEDLKRCRVLLSCVKTRSFEETPDEGEAWKMVNPMLKTTWNQCYPYNKELDKSKVQTRKENNGYNAVGCVGVAVAQIVAFYKAINTADNVTLNWNLIYANPILTEKSEANVVNQVSHLMKVVAKGINTTWSDTSDDGEASTWSAYNYLKTIGLTFDVRSNHKGYSMNAARIISSLDNGYPVLITGKDAGGAGGHCWVLDGYQFVKRSSDTRMQVRENDTYIHANFGWDGTCDGYYLVDRNTTNLTFQNDYDLSVDLLIYPNVRKQ